MLKEKVLEELDYEVKPDKHHAQILLEINPASNSLGEARKIIEDLGIKIIKTKHVSSDWIFLKLDARDIRDVALKLTENGFLIIKGINALPL